MKSLIGSVAAIHRYPVKSMMGEELNATWVGMNGVQGDRVFSIADPATGKVASAKNPSKWPALFSYRAAFTRLSDSLGKPVKFLAGALASGTLEEYWPDIEGLARRDVITDETMPPGTFFDCASIHFLTTATIDSLRAAYPEGRFETRRFRPNFVIETPAGLTGYPENEWNEKILAIGDEVKVKITGPCGRCVMTTLAQSDLPKDTGILKAAAKHNQARVGAYATVLQGGSVRCGDIVRIEAT